MPRWKAEDGGWFRVTRNDAEAIDIDIYGDIGETYDWWTGEKEGIGAKAFLDELRAARGKAVNLHVNSGGGSVIDAYAMMTAMREHDGKVTAYIDGLAASAASFLVAAADEVVMSSVAWMMIHRASTFAWGNAEELRDEAEYLEKIDAQLAGIYAKRSGAKSEADFSAAMAETTWFTADEAVEWGLADRVEEAVAAAACYTRDEATCRSVPERARGAVIGPDTAVGEPDQPGESRFVPAAGTRPGDVQEIIPAENVGTAGQEPGGARERVTFINGVACTIRERRGENDERNENA